MQANQIRDITRDDKYTKEGIEYCAPYWELILKYQRMTELEREMELGLLLEQRKELHRKVTEMQLPLKLGTLHYEREMKKLDDKIKAVRRG